MINNFNRPWPSVHCRHRPSYGELCMLGYDTFSELQSLKTEKEERFACFRFVKIYWESKQEKKRVLFLDSKIFVPTRTHDDGFPTSLKICVRLLSSLLGDAIGSLHDLVACQILMPYWDTIPVRLALLHSDCQEPFADSGAGRLASQYHCKQRYPGRWQSPAKIIQCFHFFSLLFLENGPPSSPLRSGLMAMTYGVLVDLGLFSFN